MTTEKPAPLATSREVANHLQQSVPTLANWRHRGIGPKFIKSGGSVRYRWSDVEAWVESRVCQRTDDVSTEASHGA